MKVKFLHIPKTAGTSIRRFLSRFYLPQHICPALDNDRFRALSPDRLPSYRLFAGHIDWALLDQVEGPCFTFTVLREPLDRVFSYYFFLRAVAVRLRPRHLASLDMRGYRAALVLSPDEFFCGGDSGEVRDHIDDVFDNLYACYFAGRAFSARRHLRVGRKKISESQLLADAGRNLDLLDGLYAVDDLARLQGDIVAVCGARGIGRWGTLRSRITPLQSMKLNTGRGHFSSRVADLKALGATNRTFDRINEMTRLDSMIWTARFNRAPLSRLE